MLELPDPRSLSPEALELLRSLVVRAVIDLDLSQVDACVFRANPATDSTRKLPLIPSESCRPFHGKAATDSTRILPPIPWLSCHPHQEMGEHSDAGRNPTVC